MTSYPYEAEVQLLGYAWNPDDGPWARFRFDSDVEMSGGPHPFSGLAKGREKGQRFRIKFDLIADDETTTEAEPEKPEPLPETVTSQLKGGPICKRAVLLCKNRDFIRWWMGWSVSTFLENAEHYEELIKDRMYRDLGIESRADLDREPEEPGYVEGARDTFEQIERDFHASRHGESTEAYQAMKEDGR